MPASELRCRVIVLWLAMVATVLLVAGRAMGQSPVLTKDAAVLKWLPKFEANHIWSSSITNACWSGAITVGTIGGTQRKVTTGGLVTSRSMLSVEWPDGFAIHTGPAIVTGNIGCIEWACWTSPMKPHVDAVRGWGGCWQIVPRALGWFSAIVGFGKEIYGTQGFMPKGEVISVGGGLRL